MDQRIRSFDIAYFRMPFPNLVVACLPMNEEELRNMINSGSLHQRPYSIRYPRGAGVDARVANSILKQNSYRTMGRIVRR